LGFRGGRTSAQPIPTFSPNPAILASAHQAETRARAITELRYAQAPRVDEDRHQQGVPFERFEPLAVDPQGNSPPVGLRQSHKSGRTRVYAHL